jgi:hypothetical protein
MNEEYKKVSKILESYKRAVLEAEEKYNQNAGKRKRYQDWLIERYSNMMLDEFDKMKAKELREQRWANQEKLAKQRKADMREVCRVEGCKFDRCSSWI